ncbi:hypothetical protein RhiirA4_482433 [Rhizophagus irregularis]|uniref:Uncharacterized protein n=1 Tax=Rhizophagus irregularis TaxID=588596 RepID=A0A2I1HL59_9GLOM|nr:hypothetical protein RhiirA4_482433 [Rhizophagus irregularis]
MFRNTGVENNLEKRFNVSSILIFVGDGFSRLLATQEQLFEPVMFYRYLSNGIFCRFTFGFLVSIYFETRLEFRNMVACWNRTNWNNVLNH